MMRTAGAALLCVCLMGARGDGIATPQPRTRKLRNDRFFPKPAELSNPKHSERRRRLLANTTSCDCVNIGWIAPFEGFSGTLPAGEVASLTFGGGDCLAGLQGDCQPGGQLEGAPECDPATLDATLLQLFNFRFWPSSHFVSWLISTADQCQPYQFITAETAAIILIPPVLPPMVWPPPAVGLLMLMYSSVLGLPNTAYHNFLENWISGPQWASFGEADYMDLGFSKGESYATNMAFREYLAEFSAPGDFDPIVDASNRQGPALVYPQLILERLVDVQAPNYFEIEYFINLAWEDRRIFTKCSSSLNTEIDPADPCSFYWQPRVLLPTALGNDDEPLLVQDLGLTTHVGAEMASSPEQVFPGHERSIAYKQYRQRAKFLVVLDYNGLPFDRHTLNFTMRLPPTDTADKACFAAGERNSTVVELPGLQLGSDWQEGEMPAIWKGLPHQVHTVMPPPPPHPAARRRACPCALPPLPPPPAITLLPRTALRLRSAFPLGPPSHQTSHWTIPSALSRLAQSACPPLPSLRRCGARSSRPTRCGISSTLPPTCSV